MILGAGPSRAGALCLENETMANDENNKFARQLEDELITRIKNSKPIHVTRNWFLEEISKSRIEFEQLTPFGQAFFNQMLFAFEAWRRQQAEEEEQRAQRSLH
jgi:hypothetical protein